MSDPPAATPDLSVVFALKCARTDDPLEGVRAWAREQTVSPERLEVLVASNGDHPEWEARLPEVLTARDRHVRPDGRLGTFALLDAAARAARGRWIYLCELHTVPDPTCAEELLAWLDAHDVDGASAASGSRGTSPLARCEARYYEEAVGSRLGGDEVVVAGRGFAIRRDVLAKTGGYPGDYSLFGDAVLATRLREIGARIGFAPRAHFVHAEQSTLPGFRRDVGLYAWGEHRFRTSQDAAFCDRHVGRPETWVERHGYRRDVARLRARMVARSLGRTLQEGRLRALPRLARELARETGRSLWGAWGELVTARLASSAAELPFRALPDGEARYRAYLAVRRHFTRCARLWFAARDVLETPLPRAPARTRWDASALGDDANVGFHALERHGDLDFRWTTPSAVLRLALEPGDYEVRIETDSLRPDLARQALTIRFDDTDVPSGALTFEEGCVRFPVGRAAFGPGPEHRLALACAPVARSGGESRRLGLPIHALHFEACRAARP